MPFVFQERRRRGQIRVSNPWRERRQPPSAPAPRPAPTCLDSEALGCTSPSGWQRVFSIRTRLLPYTVFIFLYKNMQAVCLQMLEALNLPFVCGETDGVAQFQSYHEMQPGSPGGRREERPPCASPSQEPGAGTMGPPPIPGRGSDARVPPGRVARPLSRSILPFPGDRQGPVGHAESH